MLACLVHVIRESNSDVSHLTFYLVYHIYPETNDRPPPPQEHTHTHTHIYLIYIHIYTYIHTWYRNTVQRFVQDTEKPGILYNHDNEYLHYQAR